MAIGLNPVHSLGRRWEVSRATGTAGEGRSVETRKNATQAKRRQANRRLNYTTGDLRNFIAGG
jgi:hypothetical protein